MNITVFNDGANKQAQAVLMFLQPIIHNSSVLDVVEVNDYSLHRWCNGREDGYVISITDGNDTQFNIAWFEHRSSDNIEAWYWIQPITPEPVSISTAELDNKFEHWADYGQVNEMTTFIINQLVHWVELHYSVPEKFDPKYK